MLKKVVSINFNMLVCFLENFLYSTKNALVNNNTTLDAA